MITFPSSGADDAIGKWMLTLSSSQREKLYRLAAYLNGHAGGPMARSIEKYHEGVCQFPERDKSIEADQIAELLARALVERAGKVEEKRERRAA